MSELNECDLCGTKTKDIDTVFMFGRADKDNNYYKAYLCNKCGKREVGLSSYNILEYGIDIDWGDECRITEENCFFCNHEDDPNEMYAFWTYYDGSWNDRKHIMCCSKCLSEKAPEMFTNFELFKEKRDGGF